MTRRKKSKYDPWAKLCAYTNRKQLKFEDLPGILVNAAMYIGEQLEGLSLEMEAQAAERNAAKPGQVMLVACMHCGTLETRLPDSEKDEHGHYLWRCSKCENDTVGATIGVVVP